MKRKKFPITPEQIREFQKATLMDDDFMTAFFRNNIPAVQLTLSIIMDKPSLTVTGLTLQRGIETPGKQHGVRFFAYANDAEARIYDIDLRKVPDESAEPCIASLNSAAMTVKHLSAGKNYSWQSKRERVLILITANDILGGGLPKYTIERIIRETGKPFNDKTQIIYVNASYNDDESTPLGKLLHDFRCPNAMQWHYKKIALRAKYLKGDDGAMEAWEAQKEDVRNDERENIAFRLLQDGILSHVSISKMCNISLDRVNVLALMSE